MVTCLVPHANWLLAQTEGPIQYAQAAAQESPAAATARALHFGLAQWLFPMLAFGLLAVAVEHRRRSYCHRSAMRYSCHAR
jgi:sulfite exporter TauE/SafE